MATGLEKLGELDAAASTLERAIRFDPTFPASFLLLADVENKRGNKGAVKGLFAQRSGAAGRPRLISSFPTPERTGRGLRNSLPALEGEGFDVWWDKNLAGGVEFSKETEARLEEAKVVLVAWSKVSIGSNWVADEATHGRDKSSLVPIAIDDVEPKLGFRQFQTIDFGKWKGAADAPEFHELKAALTAQLTGEAPKFERITPKTSWAEQLNKPLSLTILALAAVAILGPLMWFTLGDKQPAPVEIEADNNDVAVSAPENSIAVLPFATLSDDTSDRYFGKGVAEELLNSLAGFHDLKVAARTSAFSFEGKDTDISVKSQPNWASPMSWKDLCAVQKSACA